MQRRKAGKRESVERGPCGHVQGREGRGLCGHVQGQEGRGPCGHVQGQEGHPSGLPTYASLVGTRDPSFLPGACDPTETGSQSGSSVSLASVCCFCSRAAQLRAAGEVRISKRRKEGISTKMRGTSVVVQWFKASASSAGDAGSIPGQRANMLYAWRAKTLAPKTEAIW